MSNTRTTTDIVQTFCVLEYKVEFDYDPSTARFSATCVPMPGSSYTDEDIHTGYGVDVAAAAEDLLATRKLALQIRSRIRKGVCISVRDGQFVCANPVAPDAICKRCETCQVVERAQEALAEGHDAARLG
jgi:hypothetical protein